jgi:hypothetical protein
MVEARASVSQLVLLKRLFRRRQFVHGPVNAPGEEGAKTSDREQGNQPDHKAVARTGAFREAPMAIHEIRPSVMQRHRPLSPRGPDTTGSRERLAGLLRLRVPSP